MKIKIILVSVLLSISLLSCKDDVKKQDVVEEPVEKPTVNKNVLSFTLIATVKKDDVFQIFYKNEEKDAFEEKKSFFVELKGSDAPQEIIFNLPEDEFPNYLRLDFGANKAQDPIAIQGFKMNYFDKSIDVKGKDFFKYFYMNESTEKVDTINAIVTPILTKEGLYDPMFASAEGLRKQIEFLIK